MSRRERRLQARKLLSDGEETTEEKESLSGRKEKISKWFDRNIRKLQIIPILILVLSLGYNVWFFNDTGDFVRKGVSLAGGTSVTVTTDQAVDQASIERMLIEALPNVDLSIRVLRSGAVQTGFTVDAAAIDGESSEIEENLLSELRTIYPDAVYSIETTGPSLGQSFFIQTMWAVLAAFVLMGIVVLISFRTFYPSLAVILAGFSTVVSTLAVFNLMGFALSAAGVAAFLMLIGYSIDTDILLSTRVLKRDGEFISNVWSAAKTGLTMQFTTIIAVSVILLFSNNAVFSQIMTIILIGMFFDMIYTWLQNVAILQWYVKNKEKKRAKGESA